MSVTAARVVPAGHTDAMLDLLLPLQCGGCGAPATRWCPDCAAALTVADDQPHVVTPASTRTSRCSRWAATPDRAARPSSP